MLFASVVIGQSNYFGFGFQHPIGNCSSAGITLSINNVIISYHNILKNICIWKGSLAYVQYNVGQLVNIIFH